MSDLITVEVPLGERSYPVIVGPGARGELAAVLQQVFKSSPRRAVIVTQTPIEAAFGAEIQTALSQASLECVTLTIPDGEVAKQLSTIENLCARFADFGLTRNDVVVGLGGGVATDIAGFAAAIYHRGVAVVHIATTLLGQIDAAIGGKTGVNLPQGKNLVGAFWQPRAVICDTEMLNTLPPRELKSGLGELAKYHFLTDQIRADQTSSDLLVHDLLALPLAERVAECVRIKAAVIAADENESGQRALLNYGHTLAHALEIDGAFNLRHGEAVAIGLHYAALLARHLERVDDAAVAEHHRVLAAYELPCHLPDGADHDQLVTLCAQDKKATNGFTFVLDGPNGLEVVPEVPESALRETLAELANVG